MPTCKNTNCNYVQNILNKGGLCKSCFNNKKIKLHNEPSKNSQNVLSSTQSGIVEDSKLGDSKSEDRYIMDILKEHMIKEKKHDIELTDILKENIIFLRNEITHKNEVIKELLNRLPSNKLVKDNNADQYKTSSTISNEWINNTRNEDITSCFKNADEDTENRAIIPDAPINSDYLNWQPVNAKNINLTSPIKSIQSSHQHRVLINDDESDFDKELGNANIRQHKFINNRTHINNNNNRSNFYTNRYPENDTLRYRKTVPGNSNYAGIAKSGKKVCVLSDSICSRIKMRNLSQKINNGHAYRQHLPGGTPKQLLHYCTFTLEKDKPDTVIINVGTNRLGRDDSFTIANDIINIASTCRGFGVNKVYVSSITYRPDFVNEIKELNDILYAKRTIHDYEFIFNTNINHMHIWRDNLHLNDAGTTILTNNFVHAINNAHA